MIKKASLLALCFMIALSGASFAKESCLNNEKYGGYIVSQEDISTVKDAQNMKDDSYVTLQGNITKRLTKNKYQFADSSGTIMLKIGKKVWHGQTVSAKDIVQIMGEVEKENDKTIIDVKTLIKK